MLRLKQVKNKYLFAVTLICIILSFILSSCSPSRESSKSITIRYNNPENLPELVRLMEETIRAFERENPDVKVKLESASGSPEKIIVQMAGGVAPDVFFWWLNPDVLIDKKQLLPLNNYIQKYNVNLSDYYSQTIEAMSSGGEIYGLPLQFKDIALVYNKDMFDKDGLKYPDETWGWDDFYDAAKKLTKDTNRNGRRDQFGSQDVGTWNLGFIKLNNGQIFDFTNGKSMLFTDERTKKAIKFHKKFYDNVCPNSAEAESIGQTGGGGVNAFLSGRIGMFICWNYLIRTISLARNINWDVAPVPKSPDGVRRQVYDVGGMCISRQTKYPNEAFRFIQFYCGDKGMKIFEKAKNGMPAHREISKIFLAGPPSGMKYFVMGLQNAVRLSERSDGMVKAEIKDEIMHVFIQEYDIYVYLKDKITFEQFITNASKRMEDIFSALMK